MREAKAYIQLASLVEANFDGEEVTITQDHAEWGEEPHNVVISVVQFVKLSEFIVGYLDDQPKEKEKLSVQSLNILIKFKELATDIRLKRFNDDGDSALAFEDSASSIERVIKEIREENDGTDTRISETSN